MDTIARRSQGLAGFVARYRQMAEVPEPKLWTISLRTLANDVQALMRERLNGVHHSCRMETVSVMADPDLLSQAVINLPHNTVDAVAGAENPAIELACIQESQAVVISVTYDGKGIPAQFHEDIFAPFFTTKTGGSHHFAAGSFLPDHARQAYHKPSQRPELTRGSKGLRLERVVWYPLGQV